jgi:hypothetical protein
MADEDYKLSSSDDRTVLDIHMNGQRRFVAVTREAIVRYLKLRPEQALDLDRRLRYQFVRDNLEIVLRAAQRKLDSANPNADLVMIRAGEL